MVGNEFCTTFGNVVKQQLSSGAQLFSPFNISSYADSLPPPTPGPLYLVILLIVHICDTAFVNLSDVPRCLFAISVIWKTLCHCCDFLFVNLSLLNAKNFINATLLLRFIFTCQEVQSDCSPGNHTVSPCLYLVTYFYYYVCVETCIHWTSTRTCSLFMQFWHQVWCLLQYE